MLQSHTSEALVAATQASPKGPGAAVSRRVEAVCSRSEYSATCAKRSRAFSRSPLLPFHPQDGFAQAWEMCFLPVRERSELNWHHRHPFRCWVRKSVYFMGCGCPPCLGVRSHFPSLVHCKPNCDSVLQLEGSLTSTSALIQ